MCCTRVFHLCCVPTTSGISAAGPALGQEWLWGGKSPPFPLCGRTQHGILLLVISAQIYVCKPTQHSQKSSVITSPAWRHCLHLWGRANRPAAALGVRGDSPGSPALRDHGESSHCSLIQPEDLPRTSYQLTIYWRYCRGEHHIQAALKPIAKCCVS